MPHYKLIVLSDPLDNRDAEFNTWYDNIHLPDVLKVDGIVAAQRFKLKSGDRWRYCALYEIESDDPQKVVTELESRAGTEAMPLSDAFDMGNYYMALAEPHAPRQTAAR
jgi:hypothetical protein